MSRPHPIGSCPPRAPFRAALGAACVVAGLVPAGCGPDENRGTGISAEEYVGVVVALREAERELVDADSAEIRFERRKSEILAERGVTEEQVLDFLRAHWHDPRAMQEVWDTISERLKYLSEEGLDPEDLMER